MLLAPSKEVDKLEGAAAADGAAGDAPADVPADS
jgi:hypothetical protein